MSRNATAQTSVRHVTVSSESAPAAVHRDGKAITVRLVSPWPFSYPLYCMHAKSRSFYPEISEVSHSIIRTIFLEHLTSATRDVTCKGIFFLKTKTTCLWMKGSMNVAEVKSEEQII